MISDNIDSTKNDTDMERTRLSEANFDNCLVQGQYETMGDSRDCTTYAGLDDDEVNVLRGNDDVSKVRSQFSQRLVLFILYFG